ncbi:hypothetical protein Cni_G18823 [Canna indica]|uniref:Uncharacterized protein n=1 Tax=Canna indica TaxID=4628 RepID=A0AAQ3KL35_9LILI|nr:hypothetical protein Cni_G18823 [Canna indica]
MTLTNSPTSNASKGNVMPPPFPPFLIYHNTDDYEVAGYSIPTQSPGRDERVGHRP